MYRILFLLPLLFTSFQAFGIDKDSLLNVYHNSNLPDSSRLKAIATIADEVLFENPDSGMHYGRQYLSFSQRIKDSGGQIEALNNLGISHGMLMQFDSALHYFNRMNQKAMEAGDNPQRVRALGNIANVEIIIGKEYDAIQSIKMAIALSDSVENARDISLFQANLGSILQDYDTEKSRRHYREALQYALKEKDSVLIARTYAGLTLVLVRDSAYNEAKEESLKGLKYTSNLPNSRSSLYNTLAVAEMETGNLSPAKDALAQSFDAMDSLNYPRLYMQAISIKAQIFLKAGEPENVIAPALAAYSMAKEADVNSTLKVALRCLYEAYEQLGQEDKALLYLKELNTVQSNQFREENFKRVLLQEAEIRHSRELFRDSISNAQRMQAETQEREKLQTQQHWIIIFSVVFGIAAIAFILFAIRRYKIEKTQKQKIKEQQDLLHAEFIQLKEFTENASHELQTPVTIIQSKLENLMSLSDLKRNELNEIRTVYSAAGRLANMNHSLLLLYRIDNKQYVLNEAVNLSESVSKHLDWFEELIANKKVTLTHQIQENVIKQSNTLIVDRIISNLIKNAIRHNKEKGFIDVRLTETAFKISNSGEPLNIPAERLFERFSKNNSATKGTGLGLAIVKKATALNKWTISYTETDGTHTITISF